jgi:hypothetical protein
MVCLSQVFLSGGETTDGQMRRDAIAKCGGLHCTRLLPDSNDRCRSLLFQAMSIAGRGRAAAAIAPAEYAIPRAKTLAGGKVALQRLTAP